jgi:hypothetical protein
MPRRALEWSMSLFSTLLGLYILAFEAEILPQFVLGLGYDVHLPGWGWPLALSGIGGFQVAALVLQHQGLRRISAGVASFVWFLVMINLVEGGFHALGFPIGFWCSVNEFYVCAVLRGAPLWQK